MQTLSGLWRMLEGFVVTVGMFGFYLLVIAVIPMIAALYFSRLIPLAGWRRRGRSKTGPPN